MVDIDSDNEEDFHMATLLKSRQQIQSQPQSQSLIPQTPLQAEVARYLSYRDEAYRPAAGITFDVLGWWSAHEKIFPLMSKAAKKYLAVQATPFASERTFSTSGATVITQRTKSDPTNIHYLVYCKENLPKIKIVRTRVEDEEEKDLEE